MLCCVVLCCAAHLPREGCGQEGRASTPLEEGVEALHVDGDAPEAAAHSLQGWGLNGAALDDELPVGLGQRFWPHNIGIHDLQATECEQRLVVRSCG